MKGKERNSSFELLRILCILGILYMHVLGEFGSEMSQGTAVLRIFSDSIFNAGVSCFILISGFFGIRLDIKKLIQLDCMVIFYDLVGVAIYSFYGNELGLMELVSSVLPIITRKYWFLSCYFFLALLSPFINKIVEQLQKKEFQKLLLAMLILFYVIPTFLYFEIMQDHGKGLVHMTVVYLIGRYIAKYEIESKRTRGKLLIFLCVNVLLIFVLNLGTTLIKSSVSTLWSRDCSIFILITAVLVFQIFKKTAFNSRIINKVASSVLAVYVLSPYIQFVMEQYLKLQEYDGQWYLPLMVGIIAIAIVVICVVTEMIRKKVFGKIEERISEFIETLIYRIYGWVQKKYPGMRD